MTAQTRVSMIMIDNSEPCWHGNDSYLRTVLVLSRLTAQSPIGMIMIDSSEPRWHDHDWHLKTVLA